MVKLYNRNNKKNKKGIIVLIMSYKRNHLKRRLKTRKKFIKRPVFWFFVLFIIIIAILYFVLFLPEFQVTKINISGNKKIQSQDIENIALADINKKIFTIGYVQILTKSIFIVDKNNLIKDILKKFPEIENVEVQKKIPNNITLKINERKIFAVFCNGEKSDECFSLDENGVIFEKLENIPQDMIIIRIPSYNKEIFTGENVVEKKIIDMISKIQKNLKNNFQIDITQALVLNPLVLKTNENWQAYFDTNSDIDLQITKINMLLRDEIPVNTRKNLQYIYLQYKDRAYYK